MDDARLVASTAFSASGASGLYDRTRPAYPPEAIARIVSCLPPKASVVVELGSGTGIFTRALLSAAAPGQIGKLVAIEPAHGMRLGFGQAMKAWTDSIGPQNGASGSAQLPALECHDGLFADMGPAIASNSAALVVAAQAWHWVGGNLSLQEQSVAEVQRVLKSGGYFALIWNLKDRESADWVGKIRDAYEIYENDHPQYRQGWWKYLFKTATFRSSFRLLPPSESVPPHVRGATTQGSPGSKPKNVNDSIDKSPPTLTIRRGVPTTFAGLYDRILSKSFMCDLDPAQKEAFKSKLHSIWQQDVVGNPAVEWIDETTISFPYITDLYLMQKER